MTKYQKKELDRLWQQAIHLRDKYCQICHKTTALNGHHIFSRSRMNTRWDLENGIILCVGCHNFSNLLSAHKAPRAFFKWLEEKKGKKWLDDLEHRSQMISKNMDYNLIKLYLKNEIKKYDYKTN